MKRFIAVFVVIISVAIYSHQAEALEAEFIRNNLAKIYEGTFKWHGGKSIQGVSVTISNLSVDSDGNVVALGAGEYKTAKGDTKIDIKLQISPNSLRFEMWEMNPKGGSSFVTDGSHIGTISEDLKTINAVWTTKSTGKQGDLTLKAK